MKRYVIILLTLIFIPCAAAQVDDIPTYTKEDYIATANFSKTLELSMAACVDMALENNSEINVVRLEPKIKDGDVRIQKSRFEPRFTFDWTMESNTDLSRQTLTGVNPTKTRTGIFNFGFNEMFTTGTKINLDFLNTRTTSNSIIQTLNPEYDSEAMVTVTQPLLKGFGIQVNKADYMIAKNNKLKSVQQFTKDVIDTLTKVKKEYYEYQYAQEQYGVAEASLKRSRSLHSINTQKYVKGLASDVDLLQSEAEVANMEQALVYSEGQVQIAEDNLKLVTNLIDDVKLWNAAIVTDNVSYEKFEANVVQSIIRAFDHRPDYEAAKLDLKNRDISVVFYRNNMLPTLDLIGSYGLNGLGNTYEKDLGHIGGGKYQDWIVGVKVKVPFFSDEEKGKYEKSKLEKRQTLIAFKRLEQKIILEVRKAVRDVDIRYRMLQASKIAKEAQEKNYAAQEVRFAAGLVSTHDIVDYQERLAKAELNFIRSIIDYNIALIELSRAEGTTLVNDNIAVQY